MVAISTPVGSSAACASGSSVRRGASRRSHSARANEWRSVRRPSPRAKIERGFPFRDPSTRAPASYIAFRRSLSRAPGVSRSGDTLKKLRNCVLTATRMSLRSKIAMAIFERRGQSLYGSGFATVSLQLVFAQRHFTSIPGSGTYRRDSILVQGHRSFIPGNSPGRSFELDASDPRACRPDRLSHRSVKRPRLTKLYRRPDGPVRAL